MLHRRELTRWSINSKEMRSWGPLSLIEIWSLVSKGTPADSWSEMTCQLGLLIKIIKYGPNLKMPPNIWILKFQVLMIKSIMILGMLLLKSEEKFIAMTRTRYNRIWNRMQFSQVKQPKSTIQTYYWNKIKWICKMPTIRL